MRTLRNSRCFQSVAGGLVLLLAPAPLHARQQQFTLSGDIVSTSGKPLPGATVTAGGSRFTADSLGHFALLLPRGSTRITVAVVGYTTFTADLDIEGEQTLGIELRPADSITVHAGDDVLSPDPSASAYTREDLLPANPGRPGIPFSVPGFPTESASGGIKAPSTLLPVSLATTASPLPSSSASATFFSRTTSPPTPTATAMPTPTWSYLR